MLARDQDPRGRSLQLHPTSKSWNTLFKKSKKMKQKTESQKREKKESYMRMKQLAHLTSFLLAKKKKTRETPYNATCKYITRHLHSGVVNGFTALRPSHKKDMAVAASTPITPWPELARLRMAGQVISVPERKLKGLHWALHLHKYYKVDKEQRLKILDKGFTCKTRK